MRQGSGDIAIIGMACMFPKANDLDRYWRNILGSVDAVQEVPPDRWSVSDFFSPDRLARDRSYSKWGGFLGTRVFDPMKWRIPPASLRSIEPVQLIALEVAAEAMADAGYDKRDFPRERTGVLFACAGSHEVGSSYNFRTMMRHFLPRVEGLEPHLREHIYASLEDQLPEWTEDSFPGFLMNVVAGRIARELNVNGPNYVVDAACAASLAALHAAIEQLRSGTSDMMLVGACDATNNAFCFMSFSKTHALSPRGRSRPFDESADGIGLGEGIGCVVLKRREDAEREGDRIYAVIKGIGSSSDGKNKSLTAPYPPGQIKAVERAYADAEISPASISLVEAHGTGTVVGDSAEITTLTQVFAASSHEKQFAAVGSVKSMIGHTKTVAGIASLIKTALAVHQGVLPPTIGVEKPTSKVDFANSPFYVNSETRPWLDEIADAPRRAAISAFGFGGTNFHVVLEEHPSARLPEHQVDRTPRPAEIFVWRRADRSSLVADLASLDAALEGLATENLAGLASAVAFEEARRAETSARARLGMVAGSLAELRQKLRKAQKLLADRERFVDPSGIFYSEETPVQVNEICFLYPGQGSQTVNMMRDLVVSCRWGHDLFHRANRIVADYLPRPLTRYIYPVPAFGDAEREKQFDDLSDTRVAQPAIGVIGLFVTQLLARFGVEPGVMAGHSYGEHVALAAAGSITDEELILLSAIRGRICEETGRSAPGGMAAVRADADTATAVLEELGGQIYLANLNAPDQTIVAGLVPLVEAAIAEFNKRGIKARRIPVPAAFHTPMLVPAAQQLAAHLAKASFVTPRVPVYGNTTNEIHSGTPDEIRAMLTRHLAEPVRFEGQIRRIYADGARVFLEVGPGKVLSGLVDRILGEQPHVTLAVDAPGRDSWTQLGHVLTQAAALGLPVNVGHWYQGRGLGERTVAEFVDEAKRASTPKPSDWILGPAKLEPVTPLPARRKERVAPAIAAKPPAAPPVAPKPAAASPVAAEPASPSPTPAQVAAPASVSAPPPPPAVPAGPVPQVRSTPQPGAVPRPIPAVPRSGLFPPLRPISSVRASKRVAESMSNETSVSANGVPAVSGTPVNVELLAQFQATTRVLLEMQHSQNRLVERFLDCQERMLYHFAGGSFPMLEGQAIETPLALESVAAPPPPPPMAAIPAPAPVAASAPAPAPAPAPVAVARAPIAMPTPTSVTTKVVPTPAAAPAPAPVTARAPAPAPAAPAKAPPAAPAPAPAAETAGANAPPPVDVFRQDLLQIVSERTGYPTDMLDEELPLEAGLGIDSIKTVEIFSNLKDYHAFFRTDDQDEEEALTEFTNLKTLKDIIDSYDRRRQAILAGGGGGGSGGVANGQARSGGGAGTTAAAGGVERFSLTAVEAPPEGNGAKKNFLGATSS